MHRFYLPPAEWTDSRLTLTGREAHHALHVLRLKRGERASVLDGAGYEYLCEIAEASWDRLQLTICSKVFVDPPPVRITLVQALPRGKLFDSVVQKATELGVSHIAPLLSERVVTQIDSTRVERKLEHWQAVAIEAIKQCGSTWLPRIDPPRTPREYLERGARHELSLIASLQGERRHPRFWIDAFRAERGRGPEAVEIWVGPEGDFTPAEVNAIQTAGALPISLGELILRTDTAAIYCLSVLNYELQTDHPVSNRRRS